MLAIVAMYVMFSKSNTEPQIRAIKFLTTLSGVEFEHYDYK